MAESHLVAPPKLRVGDRVAAIAPAGPVPEDRWQAGLAILRRRYDVDWSPRLLTRTGYLAGDDSARRSELETALRDDSIRALFCARGGYGVMRLLDTLDPGLLAAHPKPIVGFSDITALHAWALGAGVLSVHGPVVTQLADLADEDHQALFALLEGEPTPSWSGLRSLGAPRCVTGPLVGGNLELVSRLCGSRFAFGLRGAVLLLEEVGERPYRMDRALTQLMLSGALSQLAAVVLGDWVRCEEPDGSGPSAEEVVCERLAPLDIPILAGLPVGHGARNRALGHGIEVRVDAQRGELQFATSPVS